MADYVPAGAHLVGSVPLNSTEDVMRVVCATAGDRLRRVPDGETGPRADWIVWQYPVLSSRPEFEVAPPAPDFYRALPRLRLRNRGSDDLLFESLGYADAADASYRVFAQLKRQGLVPVACRFQVCLPTPLAPVSAFIAADDQSVVEAAYERAMDLELERILAAVPHDQLAIQWDTNFEFGMLEGDLAAWFPNVHAAILERLLRLSGLIPDDVELGFHFCYGDGQDPRRREPESLRKPVEIANALAAAIGRPLNWIHMPTTREVGTDAFFEPLGDLRARPETELYLGVIRPDEADETARQRIEAAQRHTTEFGVATACGWGRLLPGEVPELLAAHVRLSRPVADGPATHPYVFSWDGVDRVPDEDWVTEPVDEFGLQYDTVENHGWYRNLDPTVDQLANDLRDGQLLIDYSGGTGILLDRLFLRIFDRQIGVVIVDSSAKFLRVALERFEQDERVAFRRLQFLREDGRLQYLHEAIDPALVERGVDAIASTNAVHLYHDLENTVRSWARVLRPGGRVYVNSGNIRNPRARENEWILDETVYVVHEVATGLARTDPRYEQYRAAASDQDYIARHLDFRDRVFVPPRPLEYYVNALLAAGLEVENITEQTIEADVQEWYEFLSAYHDAVLGWMGGSKKVDGVEPSREAVRDRLHAIRTSLGVIFGGRSSFKCCWTYLTARTGS